MIQHSVHVNIWRVGACEGEENSNDLATVLQFGSGYEEWEE